MSSNSTGLEIEKLVYGGDGLARLAPDATGRRMAVLVPFTLPGEQVEARLQPAKGGLARAELLAVTRPSPQRVAPPCPYFGECGGCHLQHGDYAVQLESKAGVLRETLERARVTAPDQISVLSAEPWHYRNRIRLHVRNMPWRVGYLERRSHRFLPVSECPIARHSLEEVLPALAAENVCRLAPHGLAEVELFTNADDSELLICAWVAGADKSTPEEFVNWMNALRGTLPRLRGGRVFAAPSSHGTPVADWGEPSLSYAVGEENYQMPAGAFFQVNGNLLQQFAQAVLHAVPETAEVVWDLYAGVGLFSRPLARRGVQVVAVESSAASTAGLTENLREFPTARAVRATVEQFLAKYGVSPQAILVDPPRAGIGAKACELILRHAAPVLVYVSCDPTTLARDLKQLLAGGYQIAQLTMVDMFPQTFHLESLVVLRHNSCG